MFHGLNTFATSNTIDPQHCFWVTFVSGNISRCQGCNNKILHDSFGKTLPAPDDIVLQHKEHVLFNNPHTGTFQLSRDHRNVYYHARLSCILKKFPSFSPTQHFRISQQTLQALTVTHKEFCLKEFGMRL